MITPETAKSPVPLTRGRISIWGEQFLCHFDRREKSNAKLCPEQRDGSVHHKEILRLAQDDLLPQVRFLGCRLEMTLRQSLFNKEG
jgi:hypothetical protein